MTFSHFITMLIICSLIGLGVDVVYKIDQELVSNGLMMIYYVFYFYIFKR